MTVIYILPIESEYVFFSQIHITDPSGAPLLKTERSKFYLNVTITEQMNSAVIFQQDQANLPTDMDDIIMPFTTSTTTKYALIIDVSKHFVLFTTKT